MGRVVCSGVGCGGLQLAKQSERVRLVVGVSFHEVCGRSLTMWLYVH